MILFKNTISKMPDKDAFLCLCGSIFEHRKFDADPLCRLNIMQKNLLSKTFLTHTLTHTVKFPYGTSGTRSAKEDVDS